MGTVSPAAGLESEISDEVLAVERKLVQDRIAEINARLAKQVRRLPFDFYADDELELWIINPTQLSDDIRDIIRSFVDRYPVVKLRADLFRELARLEERLGDLIIDGGNGLPVA